MVNKTRIATNAAPPATGTYSQAIRTGEEARSALKRQVSRPVRWQESVQRLLDEGVKTFVEVGPGKVLVGLVGKINNEVETISA